MHPLLSATVAIAALSASVIGVPTPLDTRTNVVARDVIDRAPSEGITQNDGCAPGKYTCGKYYPDIDSQLIEVWDATGTWIGSTDCAGISCRLDGNQLMDRNGVSEADRDFCDAKNGRVVRDATAKGLFLTRNSPSERTTQSDDCLPSKYPCDRYSGGPYHELIEVCDAQSNWQLGANCNCAKGCHLWVISKFQPSVGPGSVFPTMGGLGALAIKPLQTISLVRQLPSLLIDVLRRRLCPCNPAMLGRRFSDLDLR